MTEKERSGSRAREVRSRSRSDLSRSRSRRRSPPCPSAFRKMWVGGLPRDVRPGDLEKAFLSVGRVTEVKIRSSFRDTYAFFVLEVTASNLTSGDAVADAIQALPVLGQAIKADIARPPGEMLHRSRSHEGRRDYHRSRSRSPRTSSFRGAPYFQGGAVPPGWGAPPFFPYQAAYPAAGSYGSHSAVKIKVWNLPEDMHWRELKAVASDYAAILFAKTWRDDTGSGGAGLLEVADMASAERLVQALDGKRVEGCRDRVKLTIDVGRPTGDTILRRRV